MNSCTENCSLNSSSALFMCLDFAVSLAPHFFEQKAFIYKLSSFSLSIFPLVQKSDVGGINQIFIVMNTLITRSAFFLRTYQLCGLARGSSLQELPAVAGLMPAQFSLENLHYNPSGVLCYLLQLDLSCPLSSLCTLHAAIVLFCCFQDLIATPNSLR